MHISTSLRPSFALAAVIFSSLLNLAIAETPLARQARSLLSNRCFACHGPDEASREGGFHFLDDKSAYVAADSGAIPIVPGDPDKSEMIKRLVSEDVSERMPPPEFAAQLTPAEVDLLTRWIREGAKLEQHWSFISPRKAELPVVKVPQVLPPLSPNWEQHPIDRFVLETLLSKGLQPSATATREELLRRLSLDLTGLPPTLEQVQYFVADDSPQAYERQVDRLLASRAYGEHWARKWLDLARYADSAGYADDPSRTIWAYRDWVINALNENIPVDQFTIEQLAGDLLPNPTESQLVATAFHRNTLTNNEGGTNDEEFRNVAIVDRVNTTMAVWMGVTFSCAQCHTHKYDPFSQEEYFKLFAIFNQSQDADRRDESPTIDLFTAEQNQNRKQWQNRKEELHQKLHQTTSAVMEELAAWERQLRAPNWQSLTPERGASTSKSDFILDPMGGVLVKPIGANIVSDNYTLELDVPSSLVGQSIHGLALRTLPKAELPGGGAGLSGGNFVLTNVAATLLPEHDAAKPVPHARFVRIELPGKVKILSLAEVEVFSCGKNIALQGTATQSSTQYSGDAKLAINGITNGDFQKNPTTHTSQSADPWWEVDLGSEQPIDQVVVWNRTDNSLQNRLDGAEIKLLDKDRQQLSRESIAEGPKTNRKLEFRESIAIPLSEAYADYSQTDFPGEATVDADKATGWAVGGQITASHLLAVIPKQPIKVDRPSRLRIELAHGSSHRHHLLGSFEFLATADSTARDWSMLSEELKRIQQTAADQRSPEMQSKLATFYARHIAKSLQPERDELKELEKKIASLKPETSVPIMRDVEPKSARITYVQLRGNYKAQGSQVTAGTPVVFHSIDRGGRSGPVNGDQVLPNRLDLARWLVDRSNPLTARVWVNRLWESLFGIGIVRTSEEFGSQGDAPTHPQLLDWLASEFMDDGWDNKRMLKLLVTSQTYMQTSQVTTEKLAADRDNIWLSRGPRVRLSAEMVRDQALAISGLLTSKMYGAPVRPPQPSSGLKAAFGSDTDWMTSEGEDRYRRGLYTSWRRSNPYPSMATFDAPSREVCTLRRDSTNTPLQALVTLNDPGFVEAAQALARRVRLYSPVLTSVDQQLSAAFELCTSRKPTVEEIKSLQRLLQQSQQTLGDNPESAKQLATQPLGSLPSSADAVELAAWTTVCNVLLNLDEVLMKR
jgi:mono/diheme cytochrome c family protein